MKAVIKKLAGEDFMEYVDLPEPEAVGDLVKIKVAYSGICGTDLHAFKGSYLSTKPPVVLGHEFSGVVVAVGEQVAKVKVGDRVTSETTYATCGTCPSCLTKDYNLCGNRQGLGTQINGSMAEYLVSREESIHVLPDSVSMLDAALTEPLACGVHASIEKGNIQSGDIALVFGAGAIGLLLAQVAKAKGAKVILAGLSNDAERFEIAKKFGVDYIVDQMKEDLSEVVKKETDGFGVDIAFECSGAIPAANKAFELTRRKGKVIQMGVFSKSHAELSTDYILHKEIEYIGSRSQKPTSWKIAIDLMKDGTVKPRQIVTGTVGLEDWRAEFEKVIRGEGAKGVICLDDTIQ
ncbi:MAG: zinc-binding dehydrogenase [Bacillota bacterium]